MKTTVALALVVCLATSAAPSSSALAQQQPGSASWQAGQNASGDNTYQGSVDAPANGATLTVDRLATVSGWFVDTTAQGWSGTDDVQVFVGTMDSGHSLGHGTPGLPRPDIAATFNNPFWSGSGWSVVIDPGGLPLGQNTLTIYLHTPSKGWWFTQRSVMVANTAGGVAGPPLAAGPPIVTVSAPLEGERVSDHLGNYRITGTTRDPVAGPRAIDQVEVWLNGERDTENASFIGDASIATDGSWEIDFSPGHFAPITSNLYVYVHSDVTNRTALALVHFIIVDKPV